MNARKWNEGEELELEHKEVALLLLGIEFHGVEWNGAETNLQCRWKERNISQIFGAR